MLSHSGDEMPSVTAHLHRYILAGVQVLAVKTLFLFVENLGTSPAATAAQSPLLITGAMRPNGITKDTNLVILKGRILIRHFFI